MDARKQNASLVLKVRMHNCTCDNVMLLYIYHEPDHHFAVELRPNNISCPQRVLLPTTDQLVDYGEVQEFVFNDSWTIDLDLDDSLHTECACSVGLWMA